jgi:uncharacterized membrane protein YhdT
MTHSQIILILANIWIVHGIKDTKFALGVGICYLIVYIIFGIFGK